MNDSGEEEKLSKNWSLDERLILIAAYPLDQVAYHKDSGLTDILKNLVAEGYLIQIGEDKYYLIYRSTEKGKREGKILTEMVEKKYLGDKMLVMETDNANKSKFRDDKITQWKIDNKPIWKHLKDGATKKETEITNKDSGKFAEIIGGRILWNYNESKILNEIFPDIKKIISANRMTGLGVGDVAYKISYKKHDGKEGNQEGSEYGQRIVIFEIKHGKILIGRFQFEKYCRIISEPKNYFPKAEDVRVIFMMFEKIDTVNKKASYSFYELDKELALKFLEIQRKKEIN